MRKCTRIAVYEMSAGNFVHHIILHNIFTRKTTINNRIEKAHAGFVTQSL